MAEEAGQPLHVGDTYYRGSRARRGAPPALRDRLLQPCLGNQFGAHHRGGPAAIWPTWPTSPRQPRFLFVAFRIPYTPAVGVKLIATPWTDANLQRVEGITAERAAPRSTAGQGRAGVPRRGAPPGRPRRRAPAGLRCRRARAGRADALLRRVTRNPFEPPCRGSSFSSKSVAAAAFRRRLPEMSEVHGASLTPRPIHDLSAMQGGDQRTGHIALVRMALTDQLG
jgi:hypothetical protein